MSQNNGLINGPISTNTLMEKLAKASKVMQKVEGGTYTKGNVNTDILFSSPEELMENQNTTQPNYNVPQQGNVERIQNSKLPDAIKQAMIDKPIQQISQISLNETLDMNFIQGAKRLMEQEGTAPKQKQQQQIRPSSNTPSNVDMNSLAVLIENTVRKVMDEKLNQILSAHQTTTMNENLVLKVGDSIFKGKITGVNKSK